MVGDGDGDGLGVGLGLGLGLGVGDGDETTKVVLQTKVVPGVGVAAAKGLLSGAFGTTET